MTCTDQLPYCCLAVLLSLLVVTMFSDKFTGGSFSRYTQPRKEERKGRGDEESAVYATATSLTDVVLVVMIHPHRALDIPILQRHYVGYDVLFSNFDTGMCVSAFKEPFHRRRQEQSACPRCEGTPGEYPDAWLPFDQQ